MLYFTNLYKGSLLMKLSKDYLGGFFDADGSVGLYKRNNTGNGWQVNVTIANSGKQGEILCKQLAIQFDGCVVYKTNPIKSTHRPVFWWRINGREKCKTFLLFIKDSVFIKKNQVDLCLYFLDYWDTLPKHNKNKKDIQKIEEIAQKIKDLKRE